MDQIKFSLILMVMAALVGCHEQKQQETEVTSVDSLVVETTPTLLYGIPIDSFEVLSGKVRWNQSLSDILKDYNTPHTTIYDLANKSEGVFDVRKLKAGYPYTIIHERDSLKTARQFIFEPDPTQYVVFQIADTTSVYRVEKPIITREKEVSVQITSSVYQVLEDVGASTLLVHKLVDIFAWQVSFQHIDRNDHLKVVYEEQLVDDEVVGIGRIKAAHFLHRGKSYYGIYYNQGGKSDYFDENGLSLRKTMLKAPLDYKRISSRYTPRRFHPVLKRYKAHLGTDFAAPTGTPIRSVGDGLVLEAQYGKYNGYYVKIKHNSNFTTQYLHMSKISRGIRPGVRVKQGQTIGLVGSTGLARGAHLCFRFWKNGVQVDALKVDLPSTEPIYKEEIPNFLHTKNVMIHQLDNIEERRLATPVLAEISTN